MLYVAAAYVRLDGRGIVRVAMPLRAVDVTIGRLRTFLLIAGPLRNMPNLWVGSSLHQGGLKCPQNPFWVSIDPSFFSGEKKEDLAPGLSLLFYVSLLTMESSSGSPSHSALHTLLRIALYACLFVRSPSQARSSSYTLCCTFFTFTEAITPVLR